MNIPSRWLRLVVLVATCVFLIRYYLDSMWSGSADVTLHYVLIARLAEFGQIPEAFDPSLGVMINYPKYAHILAVLFGNLFGSSFAGMQFVVLLSLTSLWCSLAFIFSSLPRRILWIVFAGLATAFLVNRYFVHLEIFGHEIIGNYFFAHLVAQAVAVVLIAIALFIERQGTSPITSYFMLAFSVPIIQQIHLMSALEVLAMLTLLVLADVLYEKREGWFRTFFWGLLSIITSLSLTMLNPAFAIMGTLSENDGVLRLAYTPTLAALGMESVIIIMLSLFLLIQWTRLNEAEARRNGLILKYLSLFGIAMAGLCLFQIMVLNLGYGSEYAVKKYGFGLNSALILELPLLLILPFKAKLRTFQDISQNWLATLFHHAFLGLFVYTAMLTVLPPPSSRVISLTDIIRVERFALDNRDSNIAKAPGKYDYGIGLFEGLPTFDYAITIGVLKAPQSTNAFDIMKGYAPSEPDLINRLFTKVNSKPWDFPACREYLSHDGFEILDGSCVISEVNSAKTICRGKIDFTDKDYVHPWDINGFSTPWANGSWSVGEAASFKCKLPIETEARPTRVVISGFGLVNENHTQRMLVSVNGAPPKEVRFGTDELMTVELDLPVNMTDILEFQFAFPDSVSPKELGINADARKLGVSIVSIEFK